MFSLLLGTGCQQQKTTDSESLVPASVKAVPQVPSETHVFPAEQVLQTADFAPLIANLQQKIMSELDEKTMAMAHLHLAALQIDARNPMLDYGEANKNLNKALILAPFLYNWAGVRDWLYIMADQARLQQDVATLKVLVQKEKNDNCALHSEVNDLQTTLENLKKLDVSLEKKRRAYQP